MMAAYRLTERNPIQPDRLREGLFSPLTQLCDSLFGMKARFGRLWVTLMCIALSSFQVLAQTSRDRRVTLRGSEDPG